MYTKPTGAVVIIIAMAFAVIACHTSSPDVANGNLGNGNENTIRTSCPDSNIVLHELRSRILELADSHIMSSDTVVVFSTIDIQTGELYGMIATPREAVSYIGTEVESIDVSDKLVAFSDFVIDAAIKGDWGLIRRMEEEQGPLIGGLRVEVIRIVENSDSIGRALFCYREFRDSVR